MPLLTALLLVGCEDEPPPPPPKKAAEPPPPAPDQLAPGELAEGDEDAFGMKLPRRMRVIKRHGDVVVAQGMLSLERVANYVRDRVDTNQVETGPAKTVFIDAIVEAHPKRKMRLEVSQSGPRTTLFIKAHIPKGKHIPGLSEEERWRRVGLTKDGKPAEPNKFE